jgi:hypothetical protein
MVRPRRRGSLRMQQPVHEIGQSFTRAEAMGLDMSILRRDPPDYQEPSPCVPSDNRRRLTSQCRVRRPLPGLGEYSRRRSTATMNS